MSRDYYVYSYFDPRNFEAFYYGKGKGSRRTAHLSDVSDSEKVKRLSAIAAEGLSPIIRTVASGLTEDEAHLIETTLIWHLGKGLTNQVAGRYAALFRPRDTLHRELSAFDFQNRAYYVNVGEGPHRNWDDCRRYGFLSAGQGRQWRDQVADLNEGDILVAYLKRHGFVGIGRVTEKAARYFDYRHEDKPLSEHPLVAPAMAENAESAEDSEYIVRVEWLASVPREEAKWQPKSGLYTTPLVKASLDRQPDTIAFVEQSFGLRLAGLLI